MQNELARKSAFQNNVNNKRISSILNCSHLVAKNTIQGGGSSPSKKISLLLVLTTTIQQARE
jgi:hypothetical protein